MKKISFFIIFLLVFLLPALSGLVVGQELLVKGTANARGTPEWVPGEIIVKFKHGVSDQAVNAIVSNNGTSVISTSIYAGFKRLRIPPGKSVDEMVDIYSKNPNVEYAEPNFIAHAFMTPDDTYYIYQWNMWQINMEDAWDISAGEDTIVAVIDTGVAYENYSETIWLNKRISKTIQYGLAPDLAGTNFVDGYDFVNDDLHPNDDEGHGTHVAGTIAQTTNNGLGVAGIAYNTSIMPVKVLNSSGSGTYADIAEGIYFAADNGADVINMSIGGSSPSTTLEAALAYAYGSGVTIVCASGNNGSDTTVSYPAAYDAYCIAVGATDYNGIRTYYSNGGSSLDVVAPGGDTTVDLNGDGYVDGVLQQTFGSNPTDFGYYFYQGTSMATPHVSGVAGLLIANGVATTPDKVREALEHTATGYPDWDTEYGYGMIDAYAALDYDAGTADNNPPVAVAGGPYTATVGVTLTLDGSGSYDPDGNALTFEWDFGDGSTGEGITANHVYNSVGDYTAMLTVSDLEFSSWDTATVTIIGASISTTMHVKDISMSLKTAGPNVNAIAAVTVVDDGGNPVVGATVSGQWDGLTSDSDTGSTDASGTVLLSSNKVKNTTGTFIFTVGNILKDGLTYSPDLNDETQDSITTN